MTCEGGLEFEINYNIILTYVPNLHLTEFKIGVTEECENVPTTYLSLVSYIFLRFLTELNPYNQFQGDDFDDFYYFGDFDNFRVK